MLYIHCLNTLRPLGLFGAASLFSMAFIGNAHAEAELAGGGLGSLVPLILVMVIFYFLLIRPQQKKLKEHKNLISELKKGDKVVTGGGIYGTIHEVREGFIKLDIANGVRVKVKSDTITSVENKAKELKKDKTSGKGKPDTVSGPENKPKTKS